MTEKRNPNEIPMNMNMKKTAYAEAKIKRIDILIENSNSDPEKEYYETVKKLYLKQLPKTSIKKKIKKNSESLKELETDIGDVYQIGNGLTAGEKEEKERVLRKKRERLLAEMAELDELITPKESEE